MVTRESIIAELKAIDRLCRNTCKKYEKGSLKEKQTKKRFLYRKHKVLMKNNLVSQLEEIF